MIFEQTRESRCRGHNWPFVGAMIRSTNAWMTTSYQGWCYGGIERKTGFLKVGMTKWCPICRMMQIRVSPRALCYSDQCQEHEQNMLRALGEPAKGREWFDEGEHRLAWLLEHDCLNDISAIETKLSETNELPLAQAMEVWAQQTQVPGCGRLVWKQ